MSDAHGVARDQLRSFIERVERLEAEKKTIAEDIKDVYGEAKGMGFDSKILKMVISIRKKDEQQRTEEEMILDTYLAALGMIPDFERDTPAETYTSAGSGRGTAAPLRVRPETVTETPKQVYGDSVERATAPPSQSVDIPAGGDQGHEIDGLSGRCPAEPFPQSDDDAFAAVMGNARLANVADVEPSSSGQIDPSEDRSEGQSLDGETVDANTGGRHVTVSTPTAAEAGELVGTSPAHFLSRIRPHCRRPGSDDCGGYGANHCSECKAAIRQMEDA